MRRAMSTCSSGMAGSLQMSRFPFSLNQTSICFPFIHFECFRLSPTHQHSPIWITLLVFLNLQYIIFRGSLWSKQSVSNCHIVFFSLEELFTQFRWQRHTSFSSAIGSIINSLSTATKWEKNDHDDRAFHLPFRDHFSISRNLADLSQFPAGIVTAVAKGKTVYWGYLEGWRDLLWITFLQISWTTWLFRSKLKFWITLLRAASLSMISIRLRNK